MIGSHHNEDWIPCGIFRIQSYIFYLLNVGLTQILGLILRNKT